MKRLCICAAAVVVMMHFAFAADDYTKWRTYNRTVVLNTKATGAGVANTETMFPVLVRLGAADSLVFQSAQANGRDIRFAKYNGQHLPYQIEQWNATNRVAAIWVLADSVRGNDSSAYMKMYWGNSGAADSQNGPAVFDTVNGGVDVVWHLSGDGTDGAQGWNDVGNIHTNTFISGSPTDTAAVIANGKKFNVASLDYFTDNSLEGQPSRYTLSMWVKEDTSGSWAAELITMGDNAMIRDDSLGGGGADICGDSRIGGNESFCGAAPRIKHKGWVYLAYAVNPSASANTQILYLNGKRYAAVTKTGTQTWAAGYAFTRIGQHVQDMDFQFGGAMNEVRIDKVTRDSGWIRLCFQNQTNGMSQPNGLAALPPQTLVTLGPVNLIITSQPQSQWVAAGANASFTVAASGISPISYRWITVADTVGTASTLTLTAVQTGANNSVYTCLVSNALASLMSNPCTLHVATAPVIVSQPANQTVLAGANASFSVTAVGVAPLSYKWVLSPYNTAADTVGSAAALTLTSVQAAADNSIYKCVVKNNAGAAVSNPCTLHVLVLPPAPTVVNPKANEVIGADSVVFIWNKTGYGTSGYLLQIGLDSAMTNLIYVDSAISPGSDTSITIHFAASLQSYWLQVESNNSVGWGVASTARRFTINPGIAVVPVRSAAKSFGVSVNGNQLRYSLPRAGSVCVKLFDITGRMVMTLVKKTQQGAGSYQAPLGKIPAGPYVMSFEADGFALKKTIIIP